ncbi:MAG TPA: choice-of-anchor tandem repeat GloVer-containing protein [Candidatus Tumulicola sp.]|jgi:uncharacterized repeat protein (TIGR03803 family)
MTFFGFGRFVGIGAAAAMLAGCGGSHSLPGAPFNPTGTASDAAPAAGKERVLYSFSGGNDGGNAATGLALDGQGNLYGTTVVGGTFACGTAFKLSPQAKPPWQETVLYNFDCFETGKAPHGGVALDAHGNLAGTTVAGGSGTGPCASDGCGVVFELTNTTETILHDFTAGKDGFGPGNPVIFDSAGNLYGTTPDGGVGYQGTVYEISSTAKGWHEKIIHAFTGGKDGGVGSLGALLLDGSGNLFGVTELGGAHGNGTVYKLSPASKKLSTLYAFKGTPDAGSPYGGLTADTSGNLYGTTYYGGANGLGSVFELSPRARGGYTERVLYSFKGGADGSSSTSTLVFAGSGDLYGTTSAGGGSCDCGTIFKLDPKSGKERVLHSFGGGSDGAYSYYGLTKGPNGALYGTTVAGGRFNQGAVFEFQP